MENLDVVRQDPFSTITCPTAVERVPFQRLWSRSHSMHDREAQGPPLQRAAELLLLNGLTS